MSRNRGSLHTVVGCMGSGKSEEVLRYVRRAMVAEERVMIVKPATDTRTDTLWTRSGLEMECLPIGDGQQLVELAHGNIPHLICIDEAQFLTADMIKSMLCLIDEGFDFIVSGLNQDFRGEPFGLIPELMARSDKVTLLNATCMKCRKKDVATMTQRLVDEKPSDWNAETVVLGDENPNAQNIRYEARCRDCHEVNNKPVG